MNELIDSKRDLLSISEVVEELLSTLGIVVKAKDSPIPFEMRMMRVISNAFGEQVDANLAREVDELIARGLEITIQGPRLRADALARFHKRMNAYLGVEVGDKVFNDVNRTVNDMYKLARTVTSKPLGVRARLVNADYAAMNAVKDTNMFWIKSAYGRIYEPTLNQMAQDVIAQGYRADELADQMYDKFNSTLGNSKSYWGIVANQVVNTARNFGQLNSYVQANVTEYEIVAMLDERTTEYCRYMDGTVFSVSDAQEKMNEYIKESQSAEGSVDQKADQQKQMRPWISMSSGGKGLYANGKLLPGSNKKGGKPPAGEYGTLLQNGLWLPPYHAHCRTTSVATRKSVRIPAPA